MLIPGCGMGTACKAAVSGPARWDPDRQQGRNGNSMHLRCKTFIAPAEHAPAHVWETQTVLRLKQTKRRCVPLTGLQKYYSGSKMLLCGLGNGGIISWLALIQACCAAAIYTCTLLELVTKVSVMHILWAGCLWACSWPLLAKWCEDKERKRIYFHPLVLSILEE